MSRPCVWGCLETNYLHGTHTRSNAVGVIQLPGLAVLFYPVLSYSTEGGGEEREREQRAEEKEPYMKFHTGGDKESSGSINTNSLPSS